MSNFLTSTFAAAKRKAKEGFTGIQPPGTAVITTAELEAAGLKDIKIDRKTGTTVDDLPSHARKKIEAARLEVHGKPE